MNLGSNNNNERKQFAFDLNVKPVEDDNSDFPDFPENVDLCTICLEPLVNTRDDRRTIVTLTCGHKFHLDCIGSAFNAKGFMQCPNCMQIEPGQWRYAAEPPLPHISEGDWINEEEEEEEDDANSDRAPHSSFAASAGPYFNGQQRAPPSNQLIFSRVLDPGVMTGRQYLEHPSFQNLHPLANALQLLPHPTSSIVQVNRIPALFGASAPVSAGHMFSSAREQMPGGISHSWTTSFRYVRPRGFPSSSRGVGTSANEGDGIGGSRSSGGRGGGGNGDRNGISGSSHLSGCGPS